MSDLIERAKEAVSAQDEGNDALLAMGYAYDFARALIRERKAANRLAEAVSNDAWRTDEEKAALAALRAAQKEADDG